MYMQAINKRQIRDNNVYDVNEIHYTWLYFPLTQNPEVVVGQVGKDTRVQLALDQFFFCRILIQNENVIPSDNGDRTHNYYSVYIETLPPMRHNGFK